MSKRIKTLFIALSFLGLALSLISCATTQKEQEGVTEKPAAEEALERRAFEGAPPLIPHEIEADMECLLCHRTGENDAVITSHPERTNCVQCHIPEVEDGKPFVENTF